MWISVDRYLAVRKPLRYETVQTKTSKTINSKVFYSKFILNFNILIFSGCQCWMCL